MTTTPEISSGGACDCEPKACAEGICAYGCVYRLPGDVRTLNCPKCNPEASGSTWHQDGECLRCRTLDNPTPHERVCDCDNCTWWRENPPPGCPANEPDQNYEQLP